MPNIRAAALRGRILTAPDLPGEEQDERARLQAERDAETAAAEAELHATPTTLPDQPPEPDAEPPVAEPSPQRADGSGGSPDVLQQERDAEAIAAEAERDTRTLGQRSAATAGLDQPPRARIIPEYTGASDVVGRAHSDPTAPPLGEMGRYSPRQIQATRNLLGLDGPRSGQTSGTDVGRQALIDLFRPKPPDLNDPLDVLNAFPVIAGPAIAARGANRALRVLLGLAGQDVIDVGSDIARAGGRAAAQVGRVGDDVLIPPNPASVVTEPVILRGGADIPEGEQTVGNIQAGFGIGEAPSQGQVFDNLIGEGERAPLAEPPPTRQAVPEGQTEMFPDAPAPTVGNTTTATGADPNVEYQFRYRVADLDELVPSHTDALTENPAFPQELQPRDRSRAAGRLQVQRVANRLSPDELLTDRGILDRGPMIVGPDNLVESGNGRVLALRMARAEVPERYAAYQAELRQRLPEYGIDPQSVEGMRNPVLVRERMSNVDRAAFAREANEQNVLSLSPFERAMQDAGRLSDETVANLVVGDNQSIDQALLSAGNRPTVQAFVASLPPNERAAVIGPLGELNTTGLQRLKAALFMRTYPGEAGERLTQAFFESVDPSLRMIEQGMFASLPAMAKAEALIQNGVRAAELSIGDDIAKAVDFLARLKQQGMTVDNYLAQAAMFDDELSPFQKQLLVYLDKGSRSSKAVREFLSEYAVAVESAPPPQQGTMFGGAEITKEGIVDAIATRQGRAGAFDDARAAIATQETASAGTPRPRLDQPAPATPEVTAAAPPAAPPPPPTPRAPAAPVLPTTPGQSPTVNAALAAAGAPPLPPAKPPRGSRGRGGPIQPPSPGAPVPPSAAPQPALPKFSEPVERGLKLAHDVTGIDEPVLRYAVAEASRVANVPGQARRFFNTIGSVVNEALARNPDVQSSYVAATRYSQAQTMRREAEVVLAERMVLEAFGNEAMSGAKVPDLVARYVGSSPMNEYIGTGWHVLQRADDYDLTPLQRRAVNEWAQIADDDLHFTQRSLKIPIGEVDDVYVAHAFKDPDAAQAAMLSGAGSGGVGNRGVPGVARNRNLSVEDYIRFAEKHDLEIETNLSVLLAKRLAATAKLRTNHIFLDELAKKAGGKRLQPFTGPSIQTPNIVRNGSEAWQFPAEIADQIAALNRQVDNSALAKGAENVVDGARSMLLNLDFSVGGGRQAFLGFVTDPVGYGKSMGNSWGLLTDTEFGWLNWYNRNIERQVDAAQHGVNLSSLNITDVSTALKGDDVPWFERGRFNPIRKLNDIQFKMIMPEMKLGRYETIFEALKMARDNKGVDAMINKLPVFGQINRKLAGRLYTATDDELKDVAAEAVNNMLGGIEWAKVGRAPGRDASGILRKVMVLTEGWTRAQMGLLTRAAQANPEGYVARRLLMSEVAVVSGLATGLSLALSQQLPEYDPRSNYWLDVVTPFGYVQILPHKSMLQLAIRGLAGNKPGEYGSENSALQQRWDAVAHFVSGRVGQIPRMAGELRSGKDYYGDPITDYPAYLAQTLSPIIAGRIGRDVQQEQEPSGIVARTASEFMGWSARAFPKSRPGGNKVEGLEELDSRYEAVAEFLGQGDAAKTEALKLYARLDREYDRLSYTDGIETANAKVADQLDAIKGKIEQQYGEDVLKEYRRGVKQVEDGLLQDMPSLRAYYDSINKKWDEPTPTPSPTPTKTPTPGSPTPTVTATKVPVPANTPKPNATWTKDFTKDEVGKRLADAWGRRDDQNRPLLYDQMSSYERRAVDDFVQKLDSVAIAQAGTEWRAVKDGGRKEQLLIQTLQQHYGGSWPAQPQPTPTKEPTPRNTPTPTRTPQPDYYRDIIAGRTPVPAGR